VGIVSIFQCDVILRTQAFHVSLLEKM
jgi:hypothetical protein